MLGSAEMKYAITHCWTDDNKGDLGIILSTIAELRKQDTAAQIISISCFALHDNIYDSAHAMLRKHVDALYPGIFGNLVFHLGTHKTKNRYLKVIMAFIEIFRMLLVIMLPLGLSNMFLYQSERHTLKAIKCCDACIIKGGSIFTNENNLRSMFALTRLCMFYMLLKKCKVPYYLSGQSMGPVYGRWCTYWVNRVIEGANIVYVREMECISKYPYLRYPNNYYYSNDTAFLLPFEVVAAPAIDLDVLNIGFTVRPTDNRISIYIDVIADVMRYCVDILHAKIHIFQQVSYIEDPDHETACNIIKALGESYRKEITYHQFDYTPQQLKYLYGRMNVFVGTRLHSTIFAMSMYVPCICLPYHGTKAQGIYRNLGVPEMIVDDLSVKAICTKIDYAMKNADTIRSTLQETVQQAREEVSASFGQLIEDARKKD
jgi:polysaccharide pyruvyl transferase WcaK-like protein